MTNHYEAPELFELGDATELTLGATDGGERDGCGCKYDPEYWLA